jgi:site-specific recombinase XerD
MTISKDFIIKVSVDYYLDKRRLLKNSKYPLKIRVYDTQKQHNYFLKTRFELTEREYNKDVPSSNKKFYIALRNDLDENLQYCRNLVKSIQPFDFGTLKLKYLDKKIAINTVKYFFDEKKQELIKSGRIGTYNTYKDTFRAIELFLNYNSKDINYLTFDEISIRWVKDFESYIIHTRNCSVNTAGIYLRNLRAIYNEAIKQNAGDRDKYPFGRFQHTIKSHKKIKRVLSKAEIEILEKTIPKSKSEEIAKDYWLFSYYSCGVNLTDLAYIKSKNVSNDNITFIRKKTGNSRANNTEIVLPFHTKNKLIFEKLIDNKLDFIFGIINKEDSPTIQKKKIKQFNDVINHNFKKLTEGKVNTEKITFYNGRHSWATHMIQSGAPITYIQEKLGHTDIKTTSSYIASLPIELEVDFIQKTFYGK